MTRCPPEEALSRAFSDPQAEIERHVEACRACRETWRGLEELTRIGKQLPARSEADPSLRIRVLSAAAADGPPRAAWRRWIPAAVAAVAAAALTFALTGLERKERRRLVIPPGTKVYPYSRKPTLEPLERLATIRGSEDAVFSRRVDPGHGADRREIVELKSGRISLQVPPLQPGRRFLVVTDDGEIEVKGTSFAVTADHGRLARVEVLSGEVEVRPRRGAPVLLAAGQEWSPPPPPKGKRSAQRARASGGGRTGRSGHPVLPRHSARPGPRLGPDRVPQPGRKIEPPPLEPTPIEKVEVDPTEDAFLEGWRRFKAGDHPGAAESFAIAAQDAAHPMAEDAEYWRAIALARSDRSEEAVAAMRAFLERRSSSPRAGEMSLMLGRQLVDLGRPEEAQPLFERALQDRSPEVRERARRALRASAPR